MAAVVAAVGAPAPRQKKKKGPPSNLAELETATLEIPPWSPRGSVASEDLGALSGEGQAPRASAPCRPSARDLTADLARATGWPEPAGKLEDPLSGVGASKGGVQMELLRMEGLTVRNTFIDGLPDGCQEGGATSSSLRARSAPPKIQPDASIDDKIPLASPVGSTTSTSAGTPCSRMSVSTAASSDGDCLGCGAGREASGLEEVDHPQAEAARAFVKTMSDACGFLRIRGHDLVLRSERRTGRWQNDVTVKVYVFGLPLAKRDRWQLPLRRAVVAALQKIDCAASMTRGEVYVPLHAGCKMRVDVCGMHE